MIRLPTPETIAQHVAETLAAAEFLPLDAVELHAVATRLFWNGGSIDRAIGDDTDPVCRGPGWWGLLTFDAARKEAGRSDLIAARHIKAAESVEKGIAHTEAAIREKQARLDAANTTQAGSWLNFDNSALVAELTGAIAALTASLPAKRTAAAQLRARAAELTLVREAA
jgi:hypothetical protein